MPRVTRQMIIAALCNALARPPAQAGMRLRPERELAVVFKVSRPTLRLALAELVELGILAQQQGSGTYVRCLPQGNGHHSQSATIDIPSAEKLFVLEDLQKNITAIGKRARLKLRVWTHMHRYTPSLRLQLESLARGWLAADSGDGGFFWPCFQRLSARRAPTTGVRRRSWVRMRESSGPMSR